MAEFAPFRFYIRDGAIRHPICHFTGRHQVTKPCRAMRSGDDTEPSGNTRNRSRSHATCHHRGAGFAGTYAALSSARLRDIRGLSPEDLEIALVAPEPTLVVRPRLYEPKP